MISVYICRNTVPKENLNMNIPILIHTYFKFRNFCESFILYMPSFTCLKPSQKRKATLTFTDKGKLCSVTYMSFNVIRNKNYPENL